MANFSLFPTSTDVVTDIPGLSVGSSWQTIYRSVPLLEDTIVLLDAQTLFANGVLPYPETPPVYSIRPFTNGFIGSAPILQFSGSSAVSGISVLTDDTPASEFMAFYETSNFLDFETEGSFTDTGLLTKSLSFPIKTLNDPSPPQRGFFIHGAVPSDPTISGDNLVYTYDNLKQQIIQRGGLSGPSNDTLPDVSVLLADPDFRMVGQTTTSSTFRFFVKNIDPVNTITLGPGVGWTFVSVIIPPKNTVSFWGSVNPVGVTAKLYTIATMPSVP